MGSVFFLYSIKYYLTLAIVLSFSQGEAGLNGNGDGKRKGILSWILGQANGGSPSTPSTALGTSSLGGGLQANLEHVVLQRTPYVSIHIPFYNERNVVERAIKAATNFDYPEYEVILADDSTDETTQIIQDYLKVTSNKLQVTSGEGWELTQGEIRPGVTLKHLHRTSREGFKGGALRLALSVTDPRAEFVSVFDADFVPYPDTLTLFLKYFQVTAGSLDFSHQPSAVSSKTENRQPTTEGRIAAVQGYQWHVLNKSENWITRGVRSEYAGSYVIERSGEEIYGGLKQISGAVYMVRKDVLEEVGWETSITEDFELTLKLYEKGYKVVYTPYIQAPAECVSTVKRLVRQRMRWAEGHSHNIRKMFTRLLKSPKLTTPEKLEFLYLSPYYLQALFFLVGTISWFISETVFPARLPFWTSLWGWSLVLTNLIALPLMNAVGLFLEEGEEKDYLGILSFVALSYIVVPFQAYAAFKGFIEKEEGPWFRTPKTGKITDIFTRGRFIRFIQGVLAGGISPTPAKASILPSIKNPYLSLTTANNIFDKPPVGEEGILKSFLNSSVDIQFDLGPFFSKGFHIAKRHIFTKAVLAASLSIVILINYLGFFVATRTPKIVEKQTPITPTAPISESGQSTSAATASGGQVITKLDDMVNTNLVENPQAVEIANRKPGDVFAADEVTSSNLDTNLKDSGVGGIYRWTVEKPNGTSYLFGLQERDGIRPVVKVRNKDGWYVRFEANSPTKADFVNPRVGGNSIEWEISPGITARYTALNDRIKADYIVNDESALVSGDLAVSRRLDFLVQYNDEFAGDTPEETSKEENREKGYLTQELLPDGSITWLGEAGGEAFSFPIPLIYADNSKNADLAVKGSYAIRKIGIGTSLLSIKIPNGLEYPLTIDPVTIDGTATTTATAYGNGRKILRDPYGNLILLCDCGTGDDNVYYRNYNSQSWSDAAVDLDGGANSSTRISGDLDAVTNNESLHTTFVESTALDLSYVKVAIARNPDNTISSMTEGTPFDIDTSDLTARPSLVVANKGEGGGKEKVAVAWSMNTTKGGTKRGEVRFMQCDVADGCDVASEWKNASEANSGTMPSGAEARGSADFIFTAAVHTTHHAVLTQVPGRPARTPTSAKKYDGDAGPPTYTNLTNALDDNTGTASDISTASDTFTVNDFLYIGDDNKFSRVVSDITNTNSAAQPWNGVFYCSVNADVNTACDTWAVVSNGIFNESTDTTAVTEDGSILFDEPSGWVQSTEDGVKKWWVRTVPVGSFDTSVSIAEFEVTDRHSKDLLIVGGESIETEDLRAAYVIWDNVGQAGWENIPGNTTAPAPWREDAGGVNSALDDVGANWTTFTNFPLSATADYIKNAVYIGYIKDGVTDTFDARKSFNNLSLTTNASWTDTGYGADVQGANVAFSLTSDRSNIYLFKTMSAGNQVIWYRCNPTGGGVTDICDNSSDWDSGTLLDGASDISHPNVVASKAYGDSTAIDVIYTSTSLSDVIYDRIFVDIRITFSVQASAGDALHRDCVGAGTDDQVIDVSPTVGFEDNPIGFDGGCGTAIDASFHAGFKFESVNVGVGAHIASAYFDFEQSSQIGGTVNFDIFGQDVNNAVTSGSGFASYTNTADSTSDLIRNLTRTTNKVSRSVATPDTDYRIDVTDIIQEIVCRGAGSTQPCVGDFNGSGPWASGNGLALLLIYTGSDSVDTTFNVTEGPKLKINVGSVKKKYFMGVLGAPSNRTDLDHPMETEEFTAVNSDDSLFASVSASLVPSASSSASPIFMFKVNNDRDVGSNNSDDLTATAIVKSTIQTKSYGGLHPAGKTIYLQLYNNNSAAWETKDSETTQAPDTEITLSGTVTGSTNYYATESPGGTCSASGSDCWAAWRVYQDAVVDATNQILYVDLFSYTFVPEKVLWLLPLAIFLPRIFPYIKRVRLRKKVGYNSWQNTLVP